jgi:hypothetical protein
MLLGGIRLSEQYINYVHQLLNNWGGKPLEGAKAMINKYWYPHEASASRLIWYNNGPWKRSIVYRDSVPHNFPTPHPDFLKQVIDYRVPLDLYDEVAKFDGSVYLDRTKGEASAMCHKEEMNFLSLNLLNDISTKKRSVEDAKVFYAQTAYQFSKQNIKSPYTQGLLFPKQTNTADPGQVYFQ